MILEPALSHSNETGAFLSQRGKCKTKNGIFTASLCRARQKMLINLQFRMAYFEKVQIALTMPIRLMGSASLFIPAKKSLIFILFADSIVCIRCSSVEYGSVFFRIHGFNLSNCSLWRVKNHTRILIVNSWNHSAEKNCVRKW